MKQKTKESFKKVLHNFSLSLYFILVCFLLVAGMINIHNLDMCHNVLILNEQLSEYNISYFETSVRGTVDCMDGYRWGMFYTFWCLVSLALISLNFLVGYKR